MGDYEPRSKQVGTTTPSTPAKAALSPAEQAREREAQVRREVEGVELAAVELEAAHAANDVARWQAAKRAWDHQLATARKLLDRVAGEGGATADLGMRIAASERALTTALQPPRGFRPVSREAQILAILQAPAPHSAREAWTSKMAALKAELAQLTPAESRALAARLEKQAPSDALALALAPGVRITPERYREVLAFLDDARRREAKASKPVVVPDALRMNPEAEPAAKAPRPSPPVPSEATRLYLQTNATPVWDAMRAHLTQTSWPASERFTWLDTTRFSEAVVASMHDAVMQRARAGDIDLASLDTLLYPLRVHDELAGLLPIRTRGDRRVFAPSEHWIPAIGARMGQLAQAALIPSLRRMTRRYVDAMDARATQKGIVKLVATDLIASAPLDRIVARALVGKGIADVVPDASAPRKQVALRPIRLAWEGARDPRLWCWVRAEPGDATVEEVAASLFAYAKDQTGEQTSYYAYGIAAAPPLFGLPASWAMNFPEARARAPAAVRTGALPDGAVDSISSRLSMLASSSAGTAVAIAQADRRDAAVSIDAVRTAADDTIIQLGALRATFTTWGLGESLIPAVSRAVEKRDELRKARPDEVHAYAPVALGQRDRLARIGGRVAGVASAARQFHDARDEHHPLRPILARYAQAAASASLAKTCDELVEEAEAMQRALVVKSLQTNQLAVMQSMDEMQAGPAVKDLVIRGERSEPSLVNNWTIPLGPRTLRTSTRDARALSAPYNDVQTRARTLENALLQGQDVDPDELQRVQLESQELALRARIEHLTAQLVIINEEAAKADEGIAAKIASLGSARFRNLRAASQTIRDGLLIVKRDLTLAQKHPKPRSGDADGLTPPPLDILAKRDALTRAQQQFGKLQEDRELSAFLEKAHDVIQSQRLRTAIVNAVAMIAVSFTGSSIAAVAARGAERAFMTAQGVQAASELSMGARAGVFAARFATDALVNTTGQLALSGGEPWRVLLENALMSLGMEATFGALAKETNAARVASKDFAAQVARLEAIESKAATRAAKLGKIGRVIGRESVAITGHTVMGLALGALSSKLLDAAEGKHPQHAPAGWEDALIQGASIAVGRLVHARVAERRPALEVLAQQSTDGHALLDHAARLEAASAALTKAPDAERALEVLEWDRQLIDAEVRIIDELLARADHAGYRGNDLQHKRAELVERRASATDLTMIAVKLHLVGLRELAPGTLWSGTPDEIARATREIARTHPDAKIEQALGTTTVRYDNQVIELHEVAGPVRARRDADHAQTRPPDATHELANTVVRVPGSQMRGGMKGVPTSDIHRAELLRRANALATGAPMPGIVDIRPAAHPNTYLVMLADLSWTSVEMQIARTDGTNPAHLVPNSARVGRVDGIQIRGEHVLQISERLPLDQVERVVAHGLARLIDAHRRAIRGSYAGDGLLSPDDRGRIAEIAVLARTASTSDATAAARARGELATLTEYLGIRDSAPLASERRSLIDAELKRDPDARRELARALREPLTEAQRRTAAADLATEHADHARRTPARDAPPNLTAPGQRLTREQIAQYARVAEALRTLTSERTLAKFRAAQAKNGGKPVRIGDIQLGGGAALAGRDPKTLLVDARGRWQSDGADHLAQVGQQLQDLYRARFGDVREVAGPGERIPIEAIRYWEDSLAILGDVIDGVGTFRTENGQLLVDIAPLDKSGTLTLEVGGTARLAPGFPSENIPGSPWGVAAGETIYAIERGLSQLTRGPHARSAQVALAKLRESNGTRDADLARVKEILDAAPRDLITALRAAGQVGDIPMTAALAALEGRAKWDALVRNDAADGERQVFFSKEVNGESLKQTLKGDDKKRSWVFTGAGGNAVSAAEIILANTRNSDVTLAARSQPAGLFENGQFRRMAEQHGDADLSARARAQGVIVNDSKSSRRLHLVIDEGIDFLTPELVIDSAGQQRFALHAKKRVRQGQSEREVIGPVKRGFQDIVGDMLVTSLGSPGQLPPEIGLLAQAARREHPFLVDVPQKILRPVWVEAEFSADGRYRGYNVHIRIGGLRKRFEVRGAASRSPFIPRQEFLRMHDGASQLAKIEEASAHDAPTKSGNFDAGLGPTVTQTSQQDDHRSRP